MTFYKNHLQGLITRPFTKTFTLTFYNDLLQKPFTSNYFKKPLQRPFTRAFYKDILQGPVTIDNNVYS